MNKHVRSGETRSHVFVLTTIRVFRRAPTKALLRLGCPPGVEVTSEIADMSAAISNIDVSIAPLRIARGLQNKVLEAMAHAKPVVMTSRAAEGLRVRDGRDAMIADTPQSFAQHIVRLLRDAELRNQIGQAGRQYVAKHHQWDVELARFERIVTGRYETEYESLELLAKARGEAITKVAVGLPMSPLAKEG